MNRKDLKNEVETLLKVLNDPHPQSPTWREAVRDKARKVAHLAGATGEHANPCVVAIGDAFDGIRLAGPFNDGEQATEWAGSTVREEDWHVVGIQHPAEIA